MSVLEQYVHTLLEEINVHSPKTKPTSGSAKLFSINNTFKNERSRSRIIIIIIIIIIIS